jgi:uncharacterized cupin superfamily protein
MDHIKALRMNKKITAINALDVPPRTKPSNYPEPFRTMMEGRVKRTLGDFFGLQNFGVNMTVLHPGAPSALRHAHATQDEFIYVLSGTLTLHTDEGEQLLTVGMCAGFRAGSGNAHRLVNNATEDAVYLEVGDRTPGDLAVYPDDDLVATLHQGSWVFSHKDGTPYE